MSAATLYDALLRKMVERARPAVTINGQVTKLDYEVSVIPVPFADLRALVDAALELERSRAERLAPLFTPCPRCGLRVTTGTATGNVCLGCGEQR